MAQITHKGTVKDQNGQPLLGVNVYLQGPNVRGTITDFNGNFHIQGSSGEKWVLSYMGKETKTITLASNMEDRIYTLKNKGIALDEVVVTAKSPLSKNLGIIFGAVAIYFGYKKLTNK
ncbi:carboxypeptidase-like regulatory domain-containing protein [Maribacter sp.]|uniref:carboxypeptidase-like regulatory domain-containing protein n=1 Tax=Maribacter sp. TaxID=1897614 RepID=UPI0025B7D7E8|nr:carboxypeptidase-like regulatory domain-containing protein [Maribacter sp.]